MSFHSMLLQFLELPRAVSPKTVRLIPDPLDQHAHRFMLLSRGGYVEHDASNSLRQMLSHLEHKTTTRAEQRARPVDRLRGCTPTQLL